MSTDSEPVLYLIGVMNPAPAATEAVMTGHSKGQYLKAQTVVVYNDTIVTQLM